MKTILIVFFILMSIVGCNAQYIRPSDVIQKQSVPVMLDLTNTAPSSAKIIGDMNAPLGMFKMWELPNIGHYVSWNTWYKQGINDSLNDSEIVNDLGV
jgi:hypothetical protein